MIAYVFPLIGFFLAPIYPLVNSFVLSSTEKIFHSPMASLLVFFSAIGGTLGSRLVGYLFKYIGGQKAFYFSLVPDGDPVGLYSLFCKRAKKIKIDYRHSLQAVINESITDYEQSSNL